jgi:hypothetical protein
LTFLVLTVLLLAACQKNDNLDSLQSFEQLKLLKDYDSIYVIPGSGCTGCISEIESLAMKSVYNQNVYFLFTKINSVKLFKNRFGIEFIKKQNVILDTSNLFTFPSSYREIYPILLSKQKGQVFVLKSFKP